mgnify:CR=1 FL=1
MARRLIASLSSAVSGTTQVVVVGAGNDTVAGRHLVLLTEWSGATSAAVSSIVDTRTNTWQSDVNRPQPSGGSIGNCAAVWSCKITTAIVAGDVITVTYSGGANTYHNILLYEYDNFAAASWRDTTATGQNAAASTSVASGAATTGGTDEIAVAAVGFGGATAGSTTLASGNGYTDLGVAYATGASVRALGAAEKATTVAGTDVAYSGTLSAAWENVCAVAVYKTTTTAAGGTLASAWTGAVTASGATVAVQCASAATARLKVATNAGLTTGVAFSSPATPDANGLAKLAVSGLAADTQYYYQVEVDSVLASSKPGLFKTAPAAGTQLSFSFLFGSCQLSGSNSTVFDTMRAHSGLYGTARQFCHLGDMHYDNDTTNTVAAFRVSWASVLGHSRVQQILREIPTPYVWSDHDSTGGNDHAGSGGGESQSAAQSTYREYVPHYPLGSDGQADAGLGVYQAWTIGRVRFVHTDLRSYRSADSATDNSSKTMMGADQKAWFKTELVRSEPVKVWISEVPWTGATTSGVDYWAGFNTERQELASYITANSARVVILSGDTHCLAADDGTNSAAGIPVCQAAPFSQTTSLKGEPYSQGSYPASLGGSANQFGWVDVTDSGSSITFAFTGYDSGEVARVTLTKTFDLATTDYWGVPA